MRGLQIVNKKILIGLVVLIAIILAILTWRKGDSHVQYRFTPVERGDIEYSVASTGQLNAVTTVQVGTQVSGIISKIFVDFNDKVEKGQVIAGIDTILLDIAVREAEARLQQSQAQLRLAQHKYERNERLYAQKVVTDTDYEQARYDYVAAQAGVKSAEVELQRAKQNLSYATVYAPVSGIVVERNVSVGQTVAASFSAPQLFLIANDLARMQILVAVDESDIGLIKSGQQARFGVQAYPDETFSGEVRQVRLQSKVEENIVTYTVVVDVDNRAGRLLPGMTATVDFIIEKADDVFKVANAALRFRPTADMLAEVQKRPAFEKGKNRAQLWYLDAQSRLQTLPVTTGLSDGQNTAIVGEGLSADMQMIAGVIVNADEAGSNPFQATRIDRRSGGGF